MNAKPKKSDTSVLVQSRCYGLSKRVGEKNDLVRTCREPEPSKEETE